LFHLRRQVVAVVEEIQFQQLDIQDKMDKKGNQKLEELYIQE